MLWTAATAAAVWRQNAQIKAQARSRGGNAKIVSAIQSLVNKAPATNNMLVTHKTNIADAFGKSFGNAKEGETLVYKPNPSSPPTLVGRVKANDWMTQAGSSKS
jgi:hypothetical protein